MSGKKSGHLRVCVTNLRRFGSPIIVSSTMHLAPPVAFRRRKLESSGVFYLFFSLFEGRDQNEQTCFRPSVA